jgi:hypothetical protein
LTNHEAVPKKQPFAKKKSFSSPRAESFSSRGIGPAAHCDRNRSCQSLSDCWESIAAERIAAERIATERIAAERIATERIAAERIAAERIAAERIAAERIAAERIAAFLVA